jgi:rhodanese-related sulfurtransferase
MTNAIQWNELGDPATTVLLDVRTPAEFESVHIPASMNIPLDELPQRVGQLDKSANYTLVCRTGRRAEQARMLMESNGFNCVVLAGGIQALPSEVTVSNARNVLPLDRQVQLAIGILLISAGLATLFIDKLFVILALFIGCGLTYAGLSGTCGLAILLSKAPWNKARGIGAATSCTPVRKE